MKFILWIAAALGFLTAQSLLAVYIGWETVIERTFFLSWGAGSVLLAEWLIEKITPRLKSQSISNRSDS